MIFTGPSSNFIVHSFRYSGCDKRLKDPEIRRSLQHKRHIMPPQLKCEEVACGSIILGIVQLQLRTTININAAGPAIIHTRPLCPSLRHRFHLSLPGHSLLTGAIPCALTPQELHFPTTVYESPVLYVASNRQASSFSE
jgi:hypothetical protein